jgi:hypothetical protein
MSVVTLAGALPEIEIPGRTFAHVEIDLDTLGGSFDQLRKAAQRLWEFLWKATGFGKEEIRMTDREIAKGCGRSVRWVQKALRQLLGHGLVLGRDPDEQTQPRIAKRFIKGPREAAGRVLKIIVDFAKPKEPKPKPATGTKAKTRGDQAAPKYGTASPAPNPAPDPEWEAHKAALAEKRREEAQAEAKAAAAAEPDYEAEGRRILEEARKRREAKAAAEPQVNAQAAAGGPQAMPTPKRLTQEELNAQIDAIRRRPRANDAPDAKPRE